MNKEYFNQLRKKIILEKSKRISQLDMDHEIQESHFIVPADNAGLIEKALNYGCSKSAEILNRMGISLEEVGNVLDIDVSLIRQIIINSPYADLVLLDGEDATNFTEESVKKARVNVINAVNNISNKKFRLYYRPSGIELDFFIDDIVDVLSGIKINQDKISLDGIIVPKLDSDEEAKLIIEILKSFEKKSSLPANFLKVQFLIESASGLENIVKIAEIFSERLTGIIFGMADYSSEIGISSLNESNLVFQIAKIRIVNASKILKVPAIDCMSFDYPVADKNLTADENKIKILSSMKNVHDLFLGSSEIGMDGKWVGHPLQLLALKIAAEKKFTYQKIENYSEKLKLYSDSLTGAAVIHGEMADRATNRNIKSYLRKAAIRGKLDIEFALKYGVITESEFLYLRGLSG
jgi:citrate lyase beta subunit